MRAILCLSLLPAFFLSGCASEGVIVQKNSRPHPLYHSVGIDSMQSFVLRDRDGVVRRQMVTPEVYELYAQNQYFNDLQPGSTQPPADKGMPAMTRPPASTPPQPLPVFPRVSQQTQPPAKTTHVIAQAAPAPRKSQAVAASHRQVSKAKVAARTSQKRTASTRKAIAHHGTKKQTSQRARLAKNSARPKIRFMEKNSQPSPAAPTTAPETVAANPTSR